MQRKSSSRSVPPPFSEKAFYLQEFRGRSLGVALPAHALDAPEPLLRVLDELAANGTKVIVISTSAASLETALGPPILSVETPRLEGAVWRALAKASRVGVAVDSAQRLAWACRETALRLRLCKLVWISPAGGVLGPAGDRVSFVHLEELRALLRGPEPRDDAERVALLEEVERMLAAGVPAVNVCTLAGLADELFSYAGSGTLFTAERYIDVRGLGLDDFDTAHDLLRRGIEEGYLAPRSAAQLDRILASGFGAFVEGRHLAGIGALLVDRAARIGEIAALYTLTRFVGEGVGHHLVRFALERAAELNLDRVFACTTAEPVGLFFERQGFESAAPEELPTGRWRGYDPERRARLRCYRMDVRA
jgi:amino-acid N-acetyltransferase